VNSQTNKVRKDFKDLPARLLHFRGFGATLAGVGTGGIIMASGGGFLILGGLGYAGEKIFDKWPRKKG
jgi:hypothetical protein